LPWDIFFFLLLYISPYSYLLKSKNLNSLLPALTLFEKL